MNLTYQVKLDQFEGPLDLLLHLINRYEIDIYDIPVAEITNQYMLYIHTMQQLELDIASEYLVMAATLLAIKSQMLLPNQDVDVEDDEYEEDPREELMRRLIEYRKYKEAADQLKQRELDANQIYTRPPSNLDDYEFEKQPVVNHGEVSVYDMIHAMQKLLQRKQWEQPLETRIQRQEIPIQTRMDEIMDYLNQNPNGVRFYQLFPYRTKNHIVVTFIALLELMKGKKIICEQENHFEEIVIYQLEG